MPPPLLASTAAFLTCPSFTEQKVFFGLLQVALAFIMNVVITGGGLPTCQEDPVTGLRESGYLCARLTLRGETGASGFAPREFWTNTSANTLY
jgi:hypothetical protein